MIYRSFLAIGLFGVSVLQSAALEIKADPNKRVELKGTLKFDGEDYILSFKKPITCVTSNGSEEMEKIFIGVGQNTESKYRFLKKMKNKEVRLSGIVNDPRGACVLYGVKLQ